MSFDAAKARADFPILHQEVHGKPLVYLDSAATAQKPRQVIDAVSRYYECDNANVHRAVYQLAERATRAYEDARAIVARHIGAADPREVVFVRGTTEAINLVAQSFGRVHVGEGDEILITGMEHHSNIVPWQLLCQEKGARLRVAPLDERGDVILEEYEKLLSPRTRLVAAVHVSNALGTVNPVETFIALARERNIPVLLDGAQALPHMPVDVGSLGCDFYAFSGHKVFAPMGIGVLWARAAHLEAMPPWQGGGEMIASVTFEKTTFNEVPYKFEAGTPDVAGAVGLGAALQYVEGLGLDAIAAHEAELLAYGSDLLTGLGGVELIGTARRKAGVLSFVMDGIHPHDVGTILDREGIAVRTGHHCAQPVMDRYGVPATVRASLGLYNTREDLDALARGLGVVREMFA
ncbi:MAG: cysteine desulfurase [Deltaproteobacteria bacterium]|nr:cysteine desulfurase [Deltaproteobacteria bacterium]